MKNRSGATLYRPGFHGLRPVLVGGLLGLMLVASGLPVLAGQLRGRVDYKDGGPCVGCKVVIEVKGLKKKLETATNAGGRFAFDWGSDRSVKKLWVDGKKVKAKFADPLQAGIRLDSFNPQIKGAVDELTKLVQGTRYRLLWKPHPNQQTRTTQKLDLRRCILIYETKYEHISGVMPGHHDRFYIPLAKVRQVLPEGDFEGCASVLIRDRKKEIHREFLEAGVPSREGKAEGVTILLAEPRRSENAERLVVILKRLAAYCGNPIS